MTSIRQTIESALPTDVVYQYRQYVDTVVSALEAREYAVSDALMSVATTAGMAPRNAEAAIQQAGLTMRPTEAAVRGNGSPVRQSNQEVTEELASIRHDAASLVERIDRILG